MSKYVSDTAIQLSFLDVEEGKETLVTVPADATSEEFAYIIRDYLHQNSGCVLTEVYIDHMFRKEN